MIFSPGSRKFFSEILEHNKERVVQFFDASRFVPPMILHKTVVDIKHFNLQKTRLTIHLSQPKFCKNPFLTRDVKGTKTLGVSNEVRSRSRFGETPTVLNIKESCTSTREQ